MLTTPTLAFLHTQRALKCLRMKFNLQSGCKSNVYLFTVLSQMKKTGRLQPTEVTDCQGASVSHMKIIIINASGQVNINVYLPPDYRRCFLCDPSFCPSVMIKQIIIQTNELITCFCVTAEYDAASRLLLITVSGLLNMDDEVQAAFNHL